MENTRNYLDWHEADPDNLPGVKVLACRKGDGKKAFGFLRPNTSGETYCEYEGETLLEQVTHYVLSRDVPEP